MVDTTELLENTLGYCGRWQVMFVMLLYLSRFSVAYHQLMMVVQHYEPDFICMTWTGEHTALLREHGLDSPNDVPNLPEAEQNKFILKCPDGCKKWIYSKEYYEETVVTQWDLVCDRKWIASLIQSLVMAGILLGNVTLGWVSDKYGRKKVLVAEIFVQVIAGTIAGFMENCLPAFIVFRVLAAYATGGMMLTGFVLLMEFVAKKYRTLIGILFHLPFQLGHASIGVIAYGLIHWKHIQLFCSLTNIFLFCYICLLPESVRWLVTRDRGEEVVKILEKAAKCNRLPTEDINSKVVSFMKEHAGEEVKSGRFGDLCRTKRMRTKMIVLSINWFVTANLFYGVAELMGKLAGNPFLNVVSAGVVQLPGTLICVVICKVIGNKKSMLVSYTVSFIPMFIMMVLPTEPHWPFLLLGCISMMGCSMSFAIIYLYTVELLPTVIRNLGMGVTSMIARIGSMVAPYIMLAKSTSTLIPYISFGAQPVLAALLTLFFLPETKNIEMPDTVEDADKI